MFLWPTKKIKTFSRNACFYSTFETVISQTMIIKIPVLIWHIWIYLEGEGANEAKTSPMGIHKLLMLGESVPMFGARNFTLNQSLGSVTNNIAKNINLESKNLKKESCNLEQFIISTFITSARFITIFRVPKTLGSIIRGQQMNNGMDTPYWELELESTPVIGKTRAFATCFRSHQIDKTTSDFQQDYTFKCLLTQLCILSFQTKWL